MPLSKLAVRRLTKLADFLDALPPTARKKFDMSCWFWRRKGNSGGPITPARLNECGTSACALGWAAVVPSLRRSGLVVYSDMLTNNFEIAGQFFELDDEAVGYLFGNNPLITTPKRWARRCRAFIRNDS